MSRGYPLLRCTGFSLRWLLLLWRTGLVSPCGTWDLPGPGIEPVSPALAGGFLTTGPPGTSQRYFFFFLINLFIYFWLCWVFVAVQGLSLVAASGGYSSSQCTGLSLSRPLLLRSTGSRCAGSVVVAHGLSCSAARGSSRTRARTRTPCIGRRILNHCATREAHPNAILNEVSLC